MALNGADLIDCHKCGAVGRKGAPHHAKYY